MSPCDRMIQQSCSRTAAVIDVLLGSIHSTGHTEDIAGIIKTELGADASDPEDIGDIEVGKLTEFDSLVVGAWHWDFHFWRVELLGWQA